LCGKKELDIIFLQDVTQPVFDNIRGYAEYNNIRTNKRATAILVRENMTHTNIMSIPSGRGMTAELQGMWLVISTPPLERRDGKKEKISSKSTFPYLLRAMPTTMILGGDFNCVLSKTDCKGHLNYIRALNPIVKDSI
jgi:hypothetical protein